MRPRKALPFLVYFGPGQKDKGTLVQSELMLLTKDIGDDGYALACTPQCNLANMEGADLDFYIESSL
jgi:hypothetical protein